MTATAGDEIIFAAKGFFTPGAADPLGRGIPDHPVASP